MVEQAVTPKAPEVDAEKKPSIGRMTLIEVDVALSNCEKAIKAHTETAKTKLNSNASIPSNVLRELSRANGDRGRLMMRRISLLIEAGDSAAMELLDKIMKLKPAKAV